MKLIGRMHNGSYARTSDLFQLDRLSRADWQAETEKVPLSDRL